MHDLRRRKKRRRVEIDVAISTPTVGRIQDIVDSGTVATRYQADR